MAKSFNAGTIDMTNRKMVNSGLEKELTDLRIHTNDLKIEIDFWFSLAVDSSNPQHRNYLRKPICISLFEFIRYLQWIKNDVERITVKINNIFESKGRVLPLKPLGNKITETLRTISETLRPPRNRIAAHRYTKKNNKDFIEVDEFISLMNQISIQKLYKVRDQLYNCDESIESWYCAVSDQFGSFDLNK